MKKKKLKERLAGIGRQSSVALSNIGELAKRIQQLEEKIWKLEKSQVAQAVNFTADHRRLQTLEEKIKILDAYIQPHLGLDTMLAGQKVPEP